MTFREPCRHAVALLCLVAGGATGCSSEVEASPVVPLVFVAEADRAQFALSEAPAGEDEDMNTNPRLAMTTEEEFARFETECEALQPRAPGKTDIPGAIWRGTVLPPKTPPPPTDGVFRWIEGDPEFLDPNLISESAGTNIAIQIFEGLVIEARGNTAPEPGCARSYDVSEDGRVYTFHLREGLVWSDGTPLTARDFHYAWIRGLTPETGSQNAQQLWYIKGAKAFHGGKTTDPTTVGVRVIDDLTLEVELENPASFFPDLLTYVAFSPVPRHAVEAHGKQWVRPENIVVNGAYTMTEWKPRDRITLVKNPRYWDADNVAVERSLILMSDDEHKNVRFYDTGMAHYIKPVGPEKVRELKRLGAADLRIDAQMCTYYYVFRMDAPPFDDPRVRRAVNMAIDKERLTTHIMASEQRPASNLVFDMFEATLGYKPPQGEPFDPAAARRLLAEAGYPGGVGLPKIELIYNTYESHRLIAEFVQRNLKENLGIEMAVHNMEWKSLLKQVQSGQFQISRTSWCADFPHPLTFLTVFHSEGENNYPAYHNPAYDALLDRITAERDPYRQNVLMCAAEKGLNRDQPMMPFYFYTRSYMLRPWVQGLEPRWNDHHLLKYIRLEAP
ncbi:MAG: peptide ABC transporter substrate-binding protein [Myxococcota bacterium]|nr:peptide ABC transporter substrate-binding protein [Myxococcota bacterium]